MSSTARRKGNEYRVPVSSRSESKCRPRLDRCPRTPDPWDGLPCGQELISGIDLTETLGKTEVKGESTGLT